MTETSTWMRIARENPAHSAQYLQRFRDLAAAGNDLAGEARLVDAFLPRQARVLDAGCGGGRVGAFLAEAGHEVVGIDVDPELIAGAEQDHPGPRWIVADLATLDVAAAGVSPGFHGIVCAGNVMAFLAPSTRREVLRRLRSVVRDDGRAAIGFGAGRGYGFDEFLADARSTGWFPDLLLATWDLRPFTPDADFLVALLRPA
jgi:SAM-dependent methyltransferase